jgi:hypothetical protein
MSERVTWSICLFCGGPAAVGWTGDEPVEFDCPRGCPQIPGQLDGRHLGDHPAGEFTAHLHLVAWSRHLCDQSTSLTEQARGMCARSAATVVESRAQREARTARREATAEQLTGPRSRGRRPARAAAPGTGSRGPTGAR